jgi:alkylation response protein AidB-like acyl-CoA dehydrogenase
MVRPVGNRASIERVEPQEPDVLDRATQFASRFAARAALHDREASFPFENFAELSEAGLLALTVPAALGGGGAGARDAARILGIVGHRRRSCWRCITSIIS